MYEGLTDLLLRDLAAAGGGLALAVWVFLWLLRRGDRLQRENIDDLRQQRDYWRDRAERADRRVHALEERLDQFTNDRKDHR